MPAEFDDTVIGLARPGASQPVVDLDDTIVAEQRPAGRVAAVRQSRAPAPTGDRQFAYRIGASEPIVLDRPNLIGRRPRTPRVVHGIAPRLVRVASGKDEVSATHLEVRQVGNSVVVTDLRSTNGTTVRLPGRTPQKLHQGQSMTVSAGALVDIGDGNVIEILPRQSIADAANRGGQR